MPLDFTAAFREAVANNPDNVTFIDAFTINHSAFPAPFRFCQADKDLTLDGNLFLGRQFSATPPEMKAKSSSGIQIQIVDIDNSVGLFLDAAMETLEPISVLYETYMSTETVAQASFSAPLEGTKLSITGGTLALTATYPDIINKKIPAQQYTTNLFPGLR